MEKELNSRPMKELFQSFSKLKNQDESKQYLRDLCTFSELQAMSERFQVAKKVLNGETYRKISQETGSSTTTITRVAHWLHHGMGGYNIVFKRMKMKT
jgi:TrpR-related protein YerC/YecD